MNFNEYQKKAVTTAIFKDEVALPYLALGLVGEAGEVAEKVKKVLRDDGGYISEERKEQIAKEVGDVLWYTSVFLYYLNVPLADVAQMNLDKLFSRKERGVIGGSGDER